MTELRLVAHQARFDLLGFIRNRQARFFTLVLPLLFLVIFVSVFGNDAVSATGVKASTYYVPGISALAVIAAGRIVAEGTPETLGGRERMAALIRFTLPDGLGPDGLPEALRAHVRTASDARVVLESRDPLADVKALAEWALGRGLDLPDLDVRRPSLENVYLELTEKRA